MASNVLQLSPERSAKRRVISLHVSKLRGITLENRNRLKHRGITYTDQLLAAAGKTAGRRQLAVDSGMEEAEVLRLARRADLARVKGVGAIFADMLELIGVQDVGGLAAREPVALHAQLFDLNRMERFARRAPTSEEVDDWVAQARRLPRMIETEG